MPSILMSSMLNLYPKKYKPDLVFMDLFLRRMPETIHDHLLALDIQDADALAKKADALFQRKQSSSVNLLSDDPLPLFTQFDHPSQAKEEMFFLPARSSSTFLYLKDFLSSRNFLVDSGASFSLCISSSGIFFQL